MTKIKTGFIKRDCCEFIATVTKGTRLAAFGDLLIVCDPNEPPQIMSKDGILKPLSMTQPAIYDTALVNAIAII